MNRVAALPAKDRNELFSVTAEQRGMGTVAVVEKDFWVCWTLKRLFEHRELSKQLIFKGGTSLSKVYGLVDRFSEDIDLILDWRIVSGEQDPLEKRSNTKQQKLNAKAREHISQKMLPLLEEALGSHCELEVKADEKDQGHIVRIEYPKTADTGGLLPYIQLEIGPLASWLPHSNHTVTPYGANRCSLPGATSNGRTHHPQKGEIGLTESQFNRLHTKPCRTAFEIAPDKVLTCSFS